MIHEENGTYATDDLGLRTKAGLSFNLSDGSTVIDSDLSHLDSGVISDTKP